MNLSIIGLNYAPEVTGIAPYTTKLAEALASRGHSVSVTTGYPHYPEWKVHEGFHGVRLSSREQGVQVTRLRHYIPREPTYLRRLIAEIIFGLRIVLTLRRTTDAVLLISPALFSTAIAQAALQLLHPGVPRIIWVQDLYGRGVSESSATSGRLTRIAAELVKRIERRVLRAADAVVAIHQDFASYMTHDLGVPASKVTLVRNWSHLDERGIFDRDETRRSLGWSAEQVVVLHAGNMGVKQGLENVVQAAKLARDKGSSLLFVLMGEGSQRERLQKMGQDVPNLRFMPPVDDQLFQAALASSDLLLVNEKEGVVGMSVPSKLTSYFTSGRPVLAAVEMSGTAAHEVRAAGAGFVVQAGDPGSLVTTAENLAQDAELLRQLGANGLRYVRDVLSSAPAVSNFERLITDTLVKR